MAEALLAALRDALGENAVASGAEVPERNRNDWSPLPPVTPLAVVRPSTPEGVATAMGLAHRHGVPVVPQGGLTGLAGGARPVADGIALSLERLVGIEEIDPDAATMTVRAGTTLEMIQNAAAAAGFMVAIDLGARGSCAIGGNLSTNAGGNRVIRYGMAREMVLGLEVVLPDGTLVTGLNKMLKNNAGYDLKQLFLGSEGTLGIITRAVLRLWPLPEATMAAMCGLADYTAVLRLLRTARRKLGPILSAFEVMWPDYWEVATGQVPNVRRPIQGSHGFYVLVEAQGSADFDEQRFAGWLEAQLEAEVLADAAVAASLQDVRRFLGGPRRGSGIQDRARPSCLLRYRAARRGDGRLCPRLPSGFGRGPRRLHELLLRPHRRRQHAYHIPRAGHRSAAVRRYGRDRLRPRPPAWRHGLGRAWHRPEEEALSVLRAQRAGARPHAATQNGTGPNGRPQSRQGRLTFGSANRRHRCLPAHFGSRQDLSLLTPLTQNSGIATDGLCEALSAARSAGAPCGEFG